MGEVGKKAIKKRLKEIEKKVEKNESWIRNQKDVAHN
jgi:tetrahydromethanopterin S-methyltransferase subunit G